MTREFKDLQSYVEESPTHALGLVLLMDQFSRNIYRGAASKRVFTEVDPRSLQLAKYVTSKGIDLDESNLNRRFFFYLPFSHSEDLADHKVAQSKLDDLIRLDPGNEMMVQNKEFEVRHAKLLEKFGRYPHRNKALAREMTQEEGEFLEQGGDNFGGN